MGKLINIVSTLYNPFTNCGLELMASKTQEGSFKLFCHFLVSGVVVANNCNQFIHRLHRLTVHSEKKLYEIDVFVCILSCLVV